MSVYSHWNSIISKWRSNCGISIVITHLFTFQL